ncbi:hydrogenase maturation protease [Streptomyces sp. TR02-1]|uniref:hydrogenase maturation protease n=1 Tax=Streptomyces sp. TR02-1 TaxID=3385977 RepID=UPI0039A110AC
MTAAAAGAAAGTDRDVLVAGIGNIFLGDDGFGVEVARRLAEWEVPPGVEVQDTGVRGVHLAYQLLDGYRAVVLVDAVPGDEPPGTLRVLEPDLAQQQPDAGAAVDGHRMTPDAVLGLLGTLTEGVGGTGPRRVLIVGCVPASLEEGIGLSVPVAAAVEDAAHLVRGLVDDLVAPRDGAGFPARRGDAPAV